MKRVTPFTYAGAINIGVDIEDVGRFQNLRRTTDKTFLKNVFTNSELAYCFSRKNSKEVLAGRFSAKESVKKALAGFGITSVRFTDVEIRNDRSGMPIVAFARKGLRAYDVKVSISHTKELVVTAAVAIKKQ